MNELSARGSELDKVHSRYHRSKTLPHVQPDEDQGQSFGPNARYFSLGQVVVDHAAEDHIYKGVHPQRCQQHQQLTRGCGPGLGLIDRGVGAQNHSDALPPCADNNHPAELLPVHHCLDEMADPGESE